MEACRVVRSMRCSDAELEKIKNNAAKNKMTVNEYIRKCSTDGRVPNRKKLENRCAICVQLTQICNEDPEIRQKIGGKVDALWENL